MSRRRRSTSCCSAASFSSSATRPPCLVGNASGGNDLRPAPLHRLNAGTACTPPPTPTPDRTACRYIISNAQNLVRITKGRNLVVTSAAHEPLFLRSLADVANLVRLFGMNSTVRGGEAKGRRVEAGKKLKGAEEKSPPLDAHAADMSLPRWPARRCAAPRWPSPRGPLCVAQRTEVSATPATLPTSPPRRCVLSWAVARGVLRRASGCTDATLLPPPSTSPAMAAAHHRRAHAGGRRGAHVCQAERGAGHDVRPRVAGAAKEEEEEDEEEKEHGIRRDMTGPCVHHGQWPASHDNKKKQDSRRRGATVARDTSRPNHRLPATLPPATLNGDGINHHWNQSPLESINTLYGVSAVLGFTVTTGARATAWQGWGTLFPQP